MKKVFKYGTGHEIPEGAEYLTTIVEEKVTDGYGPVRSIARFVWHYFLVEVSDDKK